LAIWYFAIGPGVDGVAMLWGGPAVRPNVLFVTVDTVRADRIGCYGYSEARTPGMDSLAASGVRFEEAYCQVPLTLPSHVSMFTGLYPPSTGVHINGAVALGAEVPTLTEEFKARGYRTGAFVGADVLDSAFGLARGFDLYNDDLGDDSTPGLSVRSERRADRVGDAALSWLGESPDEPFFAWVHFFDPHNPYSPPAAFAQGVPSRYDGEIAFVDSQIRRLLAWLDDNGLRERTLIVVAGDHGEGLGDHGEETHGHFVYNTTVRVPLIVAFPQELTTPRTITAPVQLVDLFPTIVDLLGWDASALEVDGQSLARACRTGKSPVAEIYGETEYPRLGFGWAALRYSIAEQWKYIDAPQAELYDRRHDPDELDNLIDKHNDVAESMRADLGELVSRLRQDRRDTGSSAIDPEALERLTSLGYIATTASPDDFDDDVVRRDPKEMVAVVQGFERALKRFRMNDFDGVVDNLAPLVEQSPESAELSTLLGFALIRLGRLEEAQSALEASTRQNRDNFRSWYALGVALSGQDRLEDALACFQQAIALSPDWELAQRDAASVLSRMRRMSEAEPHWRRCVELNPASVPCLTNLGSILLMARKPDEAVPLLERALEHDPANEHAHRSLWQALSAAGRRADAMRRLEQAQRLFPDSPGYTCPLAWFFATTPTTPERDRRTAIDWSRSCVAAEPGNARNLDILAAAYAAAGDYSSAVEAARRALSAANATGQENLRGAIEARLRLYESGQPFVEMAR
jgi:arylsulfatase A-like enzyme/predicted Zn-dependent protease